jgi:hypothetical protein
MEDYDQARQEKYFVAPTQACAAIAAAGFITYAQSGEHYLQISAADQSARWYCARL